MACSRCKKGKTVVDLPYVSQKLCEDCFIRFFEKRVRRTIRRYELLEPEDKTAVAAGDDANSVVLISLLKELSKKAPKSELLEVRGETLPTLLKQAKKKGATKLAVSDDLGDVTAQGLLDFIKGSKDGQDRLVIRPLMETPKKEILLYARLRKLRFKEKPVKDKELRAVETMLSDLEHKYPCTAYQLSTSVGELGAL